MSRRPSRHHWIRRCVANEVRDGSQKLRGLANLIYSRILAVRSWWLKAFIRIMSYLVRGLLTSNSLDRITVNIRRLTMQRSDSRLLGGCISDVTHVWTAVTCA